jgi:hypothetical protein
MTTSQMMKCQSLRLGFAAMALLGGMAVHGVARAADPETLRFEAWWGGLDAAEIAFVADQQGNQYHGHLSIRTHGLTHWMTGLTVEADSWGTVAAGEYLPGNYSQWSTSKEKGRRVDIRFDRATGVGEEVLDQESRLDGTPLPPDPGKDEPAVPEDMRRHVLDPVVALLEMGRRSLAGERSFVLPVYDGRRRYDVAVAVIGPGRHDIGGTSYETLDLQATMRPLFGFKQRYYDFWKDAGFEVFVGRDVALPVKVATTGFSAGTVIGLHQVCRGVPCAPRS